MGTSRTGSQFTGRSLRAAIPRARDPFVNTPLLRLTPDARGLDRFWISSFNGAFGSLGVCVNEAGDARVYRFGSFRFPGFYSAVQADDDTLWLCGSLDAVVRLSLSTGRFESFATGAPKALVFAGMVHDRKTGKLFAVAFPPPRTVAFSFDTRRLKPVKVHDLPTPDHYMRNHFANGDGTYSVVLYCPGETFLRWDPRTEAVSLQKISPRFDAPGCSLTYRTIRDGGGRVYVPHRGWYNPRTLRFERRGPRPESEDATWFARRGRVAFGAAQHEEGQILRWSMDTGRVEPLCRLPYADSLNTNVTRSGKLVCVNLHGTFYRLSAKDGALEVSKALDTDSVQSVDCAIRVGRERLLGTPFITQRFWEVNLRTGRGFDCGMAAPGRGEILETWNLRGRVYMAAYTGGELMEYDPRRHPHFPENPRVVAKPPTGMRPVAAADDGRRIFYGCSHHYGHLGCVLTRYDTATGEAFYRDDPLPGQQIQTLVYERSSGTLLCGTTYNADCASCAPATDRTAIARLDPGSLAVLRAARGPAGADATHLFGPLGGGAWLGACHGSWEGGRPEHRWFRFDARSFRSPTPADLRPLPGWTGAIRYGGRAGLFVLRVGTAVEVWDLRRPARLRVLADSKHICRFFVQGRDVILLTAWEVEVLENALR